MLGHAYTRSSENTQACQTSALQFSSVSIGLMHRRVVPLRHLLVQQRIYDQSGNDRSYHYARFLELIATQFPIRSRS